MPQIATYCHLIAAKNEKIGERKHEHTRGITGETGRAGRDRTGTAQGHHLHPGRAQPHRRTSGSPALLRAVHDALYPYSDGHPGLSGP